MSMRQWMVWGFALLVFVSAPQTRADESQSGDFVTIEGRVQFQRRHTVSTLEGSGSKTYWALLIRSQGFSYELDQPYFIGQEKQPEALDVMGVAVRLDSFIQVEARVTRRFRSFAYVSDIRKLNFRMDPESMGQLVWTCESKASSEAEPALRAIVLRNQQRSLDQGTGVGAGFELRILSASEQGWTAMDQIDATGESMDDQSISYRGEDQREGATLHLALAREAGGVVPAELEFWKDYPGPAYRIPALVQREMVCRPSRTESVSP